MFLRVKERSLRPVGRMQLGAGRAVLMSLVPLWELHEGWAHAGFSPFPRVL